METDAAPLGPVRTVTEDILNAQEDVIGIRASVDGSTFANDPVVMHVLPGFSPTDKTQLGGCNIVRTTVNGQSSRPVALLYTQSSEGYAKNTETMDTRRSALTMALKKTLEQTACKTLALPYNICCDKKGLGITIDFASTIYDWAKQSGVMVTLYKTPKICDWTRPSVRYSWSTKDGGPRTKTLTFSSIAEKNAFLLGMSEATTAMEGPDDFFVYK
jgi:hypothetical protein